MQNIENGHLRVKWDSGHEYIDLSHLFQIIHSTDHKDPCVFSTYEYRSGKTGLTCYYSPNLFWDKTHDQKILGFSLKYTSQGLFSDGANGDGELGTANYFFEIDRWRCEWTAEDSNHISFEPPCHILDPNTERAYRNAKQAMRDPEFRNRILSADNRCCVLSGESQEEALDAAHIVEVCSNGLDTHKNGITLRKDLHALFDARLFDINLEGGIDVYEGLSESYKKILSGLKISEKTLDRVKEALCSRISGNRKA
jgi:predicted restriction endonuclease